MQTVAPRVTENYYHAVMDYKPPPEDKMAHSYEGSPQMKGIWRSFIKAGREALFLFDKKPGVYGCLEQILIYGQIIAAYRRDIAPTYAQTPQDVIAEYNKFSETLVQRPGRFQN